MSGPSPVHRVNSISTEVHGEHATLVLRRFLRHPPATVWDAITDPEKIRQWFLTSAKIDGRVGGRVDLTTGPAQVHATGRVLAWDPPHLYEYEWNVVDTENALYPKERTVVRWELSPVEGGTLVVLTHRDLTRATAEVFQNGLPTFLDRLEALLDGRALPDWMQGVREAQQRASGARSIP